MLEIAVLRRSAQNRYAAQAVSMAVAKWVVNILVIGYLQSRALALASRKVKRNTGEIHTKRKFIIKSIVERYPLISYYVFALLLSGVILAILYATGLAETLFFLWTFRPGLAAILLHIMSNSTLNVPLPLSDQVTLFTAGILALTAVEVVVIWGSKTLSKD